MKKMLLYLLTILCVLTGCTKRQHEVPTDRPEGQNIVSLGLNTDKVSDVQLRDVNLFWFDETDKLNRHDYYTSVQELAKARLSIAKGGYTIIAVLNIGIELKVPTKISTIIPNIYLNEFAIWIRGVENSYPDLLTGTLRHTVKESEELIYINIEKRTEGIKENNIELHLSIPSPRLPDFVSTKASTTPALRCVAHIFKKGDAEKFATKRAMLTPVSGKEGVYNIGLSLLKGDYDINFWVDYTTDPITDNHYITSDKDIVSILAKPNYIANTDTRDAFSKRTSLSIVDGMNTAQVVEMSRPLAKYRLVATDVKRYEELRMQHGYPAMEDLKVEITYEGFLPNSFSISQSKPADAETGYKYSSSLSGRDESNVTIGKDYIFVNGTQSFVSVTIVFKNSEGKIISGVKGVKIDYRAGQLTTIKGNFLTTGLGSGITIDTEWGGDYDVEF